MPHPALIFGLGRVAVGATAWLTPATTNRVSGIEVGEPVMTQLFGSRDLALGALTATTDGAARRRVLQIGVAIDLADAVAAGLQARGGAMSGRALAVLGGGALLAASLGAFALQVDQAGA